MSKIKTVLIASEAIRRTPTGDHLHVVEAQGTVTIIAELRGEKTRSYSLDQGEGQRTGPYDSLQIQCEAGGAVNIAATVGEFIPARNEVTAKIDPDNNSVSMAETVSVSIDEIGITTTKNTVKIDPLNNTVSLNGEALNVDISGQTIDLAGQTVDITNQVVNITGQTVDISGQTVDIAGQTVDITDQTIKTKASTAISQGNKAITASAELFAAVAGGQRVIYTPIDGKIWIGPAGVTKANGYPVEQGDVMDWHTSAALHAISDSGSAVDVRVLKEAL